MQYLSITILAIKSPEILFVYNIYQYKILKLITRWNDHIQQ